MTSSTRTTRLTAAHTQHQSPVDDYWSTYRAELSLSPSECIARLLARHEAGMPLPACDREVIKSILQRERASAECARVIADATAQEGR